MPVRAVLRRVAPLLLLASAAAACATSPRAALDGGASSGASGTAAGSAPALALVAQNTLSDRERRDGWQLLFDGKSTDGWLSYGGDPITPAWKAIDGVLVLEGRGAKDIVTAKKYRSYELTLDWRLKPDGPAGNSGIFYYVVDTASAIYWAAPEMAVLDNARHPDGKTELTSSGAVHSMYPVPHERTRPTGEWNSVRLVVNGAHIEQWLNGVRVVEYELGSADWKERLAKSKFSDKPLYGTAREGRIGLQQHGSYVGYRNIKIREIK